MLKSSQVLQSNKRIASVDVFRSVAILSVVFYHFNGFLPYGYFGVDLFFVISGLLVGGIVINQFKGPNGINFWKFIFQRGFKIWPSYYWFLLFGSIVAILFYSNLDRYFIINPNFKDISRYIFFYQNYTGGPAHIPFDVVWSLCIEEHFYLLLPLALIITAKIFSNRLQYLFLTVGCMILAGIVFKILSLFLTKSGDTYMGTHNKLDALGWGVLLAVFINYFGSFLQKQTKLKILFPIGVLLFAAGLTLYVNWDNYYFKKVVFYSVSPFCFFLMILGLYYHDFSKWKPFRFIAYYSYNWYLWHSMFVLIISHYLGINLIAFLVYLIVSFGTAMLFTILIEEKFLSIRERVINRMFKPSA
jgi:peptidoglycan/LPS O-acetylase OafA/YrhL